MVWNCHCKEYTCKKEMYRFHVIYITIYKLIVSCVWNKIKSYIAVCFLPYIYINNIYIYISAAWRHSLPDFNRELFKKKKKYIYIYI